MKLLTDERTENITEWIATTPVIQVPSANRSR